jgi:hypothetical protein
MEGTNGDSWPIPGNPATDTMKAEAADRRDGHPAREYMAA